MPPAHTTPPSHNTTTAASTNLKHNGSHNHQIARERVTDIQRARLIAAMAEACAEHGAANVTVTHVVAVSGVSRRTFYEQFTDREDCFLTALEEALGCAIRYVLPAYHTPGRWRDRIKAALTALLTFAEDEPYLARLLVVESLGAGEHALRRRQQILSRLIQALDEGRSERRSASEPPSLTAEGALGGVLSVLHSRLSGAMGGTHGPGDGSLVELTGQLTSMLVLPYLGAAAAQRELSRAAPTPEQPRRPTAANPLRDLEMRLTYRTVRVLLSIADRPGASNRELGVAADVADQGQMSKLLTRLQKLGLVENTGAGHTRGAPNAWMLTKRGSEVQQALAGQTTTR